MSLGHADNPAAEHWLREVVRPLGLPGLVACTHLVRVPYPHVAISLAVPAAERGGAGRPGEPAPADGPVEPAGGPVGAPAGGHAGAALAGLPVAPDGLREAAELAAAEHTARRSGRAVLFPGVERLVGTMTVAEVLAETAIDRVRVLGGEPAGPGTLLQTRDFVRPQWLDGVLTLVATPAGAGRIAPFEVPNPTPCCADH
ncbi:hypothetical protein AB0J86_22815 [Micromonospora sp. NPDC049559]|uniref:hypothetical protein n=1 Tax=Micromonospora sp. NPDC049559 TaxID=3155923 RepID=UPI00341BCBB8